jgi:glycosyltransferase involved in cell wall biosynthesis
MSDSLAVPRATTTIDAIGLTHRAPAPDISVVIVCYDRMALLERTLRACFAQVLPAGVTWEIVVADNHPDELSARLVAGLESPVPLRRLPARPVRNIARARNVGVAAARGRLIAFIDDDEAPEPDWLASHMACLERTGADASFGPKFPIFEDGAPPDWDPDGWFFTVDFGMAQDAEIRPLDWSPRSGRGLGTGNSMLRAATCLAGEATFDEHYGRTGGEDTRLFFDLAKKGRRFVWCPSARVIEFNMRERASPDYMLARLRRSAQHSANCRLAVSDNRLVSLAGIYGIGLAQVVVHGILRVATWRAGAARRVKHRLGMAKGLGKLGFGPPLDFIPEKGRA